MSEASFQAPELDQLAELLPQYDIEAFIAQGGMGAVYKGRQRSLDRDVAIKVLPRELGADPEFRESFATEAKAMARLNHPNLLGVYDYGDVDGMPYIVMEYVHGQSLHHSSWNQAVDSVQAATIVKGICDGLAHAHQHGIVHRDIKPANILLTPSAEPKIGDFGLAHSADADGPGLVMGTPGYTAPEVFSDPDQANILADIYSVGVILHQLLTGIDPTGSQSPPTQSSGNIRLDAIWRKATHMNPAQRYPDAGSLAVDLEKFLAAKRSGVPLATGPVGYKAPATSVKSASGFGGGVFIKLVVIAVLSTVVWFTWQLLQDHKQNLADIAKRQAEEEAEAARKKREEALNKKPEVPDNPERVRPEPLDPRPDPGMANKDPDPVDPGITDPDPDPVRPAELPPGDPDLREKAIGLILKAREDRDKELAENTRSFLFKLEVAGRSASANEVRLIGTIKEGVVDDRIPAPDEVPWLPSTLAEMYKHAENKQQSIDNGHQFQLGRIRDAYVGRLKSAAAETSDAELKKKLEAQAQRAEDLNAWVTLLAGAERKPAAPAAGGEGAFRASLPPDLAGRWKKRENAGEIDWILHEDGRIESPSYQAVGEWRINAAGNLEIVFTPEVTYELRLQPDGAWSGRKSNGSKVSVRLTS